MPLLVSTGNDAVAKARQWIGTPYCWGGGHAGPVPVGTCVDCSGLVNQVYGTTGNTFTQVKLGTSVGSINDATAGDLVFFGPIAPGEPHHVGIYVAGNQMIDAPTTGTKVRQESVNGFGPIFAIRRLVSSGTGNGSGGSGSNTPVTFNYAQLEGVWVLAGGNPQNAAMAAAIATAESGGLTTASNTNTNGSVDRGLWQINSTNGSGSSFDIMTNARAAVAMSNNGTNWRPWCTAYSDGACGSRGGTYQGAGSPYLKYLQTGVPPDTTVPVNGTGAATDSGGGQTAQDLSLGLNCSGWAKYIPTVGITCAATSAGEKMGIDIITGMIKGILNPLIQVVTGILGIAAGAGMMGGGLLIMAEQTKVGGAAAGFATRGIIGGRGGQQTGGERAALIRAQAAREKAGFVTGGERAATIRAQAATERDVRRTQREATGSTTVAETTRTTRGNTTTYTTRRRRVGDADVPLSTKEQLRQEAKSHVKRPGTGPGRGGPKQGRLFK